MFKHATLERERERERGDDLGNGTLSGVDDFLTFGANSDVSWDKSQQLMVCDFPFTELVVGHLKLIGH